MDTDEHRWGNRAEKLITEYTEHTEKISICVHLCPSVVLILVLIWF